MRVLDCLIFGFLALSLPGADAWIPQLISSSTPAFTSPRVIRSSPVRPLHRPLLSPSFQRLRASQHDSISEIEQLKPAVEESRSTGAQDLGFSFSVAGLLFPYQLGVAKALQDKGLLNSGTPLGGSSGGAIAAVIIASGIEYEEALKALEEVVREIEDSGESSKGKLGSYLGDCLDRLLPEEVHETLNSWEGGVRIGVTLFEPLPSKKEISEFSSKEDLIEVLRCSCHVPFFVTRFPFKRCRSRLGMDGYFTNQERFGCPKTEAKKTICVSPFSGDQVFSGRFMFRVGGGTSDSDLELIQPKDYGYGDGHITPDIVRAEGRGQLKDLLPIALEPSGNPNFFREIFEDGQKDAQTWIQEGMP